MSDPRYEITGGADAEVAAAVGAVILHLLDREAAARAQPPRRPRQSPWVLAWRPREIPTPLPSHTYDSTEWAELIEADEAAAE